MKKSFFFAVAVVLAALPAGAARFQVADRANFTLPLRPGGTLVIENPVGNMTVTGIDGSTIIVEAHKIIQSADEAALAEGRRLTQIATGGDENNRIIRTAAATRPGAQWTWAVNYIVQVPRTATLRLITRSTERVNVSAMAGPVAIENISGTIQLSRLLSDVHVESVNGNILYEAAPRAGSQVQLGTVNGNVQVSVPGDAAFNWIAESLRGDHRTTFQLPNGRWVGPRFEAAINGGGPTIRAAALIGSVALLRQGTQVAEARRISPPANLIPPGIGPAPSAPPTPAAPRPTLATTVAPHSVRRKLHWPLVDGDFMFSTNLADIRIDEVRGNVRLQTGAGDIQLGNVRGFAEVITLGGPMRFGDVSGPVRARTNAGDIHIHAARSGGNITTGGGFIRLLYAGGPTRLTSGGGDITVRQARGAVTAETKSGDITITMDASTRSERIIAKTVKGSVSLNFNARFAADIDAVLLTSDPETYSIRTDIAGLSIQREQVGGKTRIRATGKINGGGERVELSAEDGGIQILSNVVNPVTAQPR